MATRLLTEDELREIFTAALIARYSERGQGEPLPEASVERAILTAESEAFSRLRGRYSDSDLTAYLPDVSAATPYLKKLIGDLAVYQLTSHYDARPGKVIADAAEARTALDSIGAGEMSLLFEGAPAVDSARGLVTASRRSASLRLQPITLEAMDEWG